MKAKNNFGFGIILIFVLAISFLLDSVVFDFVDLIKNNFLDGFFGIITYFGEFFVVLVLLTVLFLFKKKEERNIPLLWVCFFVMSGFCIALKFLVARARPFDFVGFFPFTKLLDYSFPSLHASVVLLALVILFKEVPKHKWGWGIASLLIIFSRVYLKFHYLSDVVGGVILGFIVARFYLENSDLRGYHVVKRILDFFIALILLIFLIPVFLIIDLFVLIFTGRPVIFKHDRMGKDGNMFTMYKFRSMVVGAADIQRQEIKTELITNVGKVVRPLYLDELPQLWNVLKGDMALIGPRALTTDLFFGLVSKDDRWGELTKIKPGLTGLESAIDYLDKKKRKEIEKELGIWRIDKKIRGFYKHRLLLNLYYVRHESFILDLKIIWWTLISIKK